MMIYLVALLCVVGLVLGQILFKASAGTLANNGSVFMPKTAIPLLAAICLYGVTSLAWVWVLQKAELGRVYPLMALAFVFVPIGSHLFFREKFSDQYAIGVVFILIRIVTSVRA